MLAVTKYGYAAATTKKLAKAAGIGEVTLFRKYGNKAQLVKQAMIDLAERHRLHLRLSRHVYPHRHGRLNTRHQRR